MSQGKDRNLLETDRAPREGRLSTAGPFRTRTPAGRVSTAENMMKERGGLLCSPQGPFPSEKRFPPCGSSALLPPE